jgi:hypothetical protein
MQLQMPFISGSSRSGIDTVSTSKAAAGEHATAQKVTGGDTWNHHQIPVCGRLVTFWVVRL